MPYCSNCGTEAAPEAQFCRSCGYRLRAMQAESPQPASQTTGSESPSTLAQVRSLDDIPWWLGWLALLITLLTSIVGLAIYCWWSYRRGRRDGVSREPTGTPYDNMARQTIGWGLAAFVPILTWYASVHLATVWYEHGLRVGARDRVAPAAFTSLPSLAGAVAVPLVIVFVVAFAVGFISATTNANDLANEARQAYRDQAVAQANIDSLYKPCSSVWVDETAGNIAATMASLVTLKDKPGFTDEVRESVSQWCNDGDSEAYCDSLASSALAHTDDYGESDRGAVEEGCLTRLQGDIAASLDIEIGDCVVLTGASALTEDCAKAHDARVVDIWHIPDSELPSTTELDRYFARHCPATATLFLHPTVQTWAAGDREIVCLEE